jgi:hypothetical protein
MRREERVKNVYGVFRYRDQWIVNVLDTDSIHDLKSNAIGQAVKCLSEADAVERWHLHVDVTHEVFRTI